MSNRKIQMPREVYIDPSILKDTGDICKSLHLDKKILIVTGEHTYNIGAKPVMESLDKQGIEWDVIKVNKTKIAQTEIKIRLEIFRNSNINRFTKIKIESSNIGIASIKI